MFPKGESIGGVLIHSVDTQRCDTSSLYTVNCSLFWINFYVFSSFAYATVGVYMFTIRKILNYVPDESLEGIQNIPVYEDNVLTVNGIPSQNFLLYLP